MKRGDVYICDFGATLGSEMAKRRPALVIQNDVGNRFSSTTIVAALTSQFDPDLYPTEVLVRAPEGGLKVDSVVRLDQVRTTDKSRLLKRLGSLSGKSMKAVDTAIAVSLGLIDVGG